MTHNTSFDRGIPLQQPPVFYMPDLSAAERAAIEHAYSVRQRWIGNRRRLLEELLERRGCRRRD